MVVLVLFAIQPNFYVSLVLVAVLATTMFFPVKFVHPVRTARWRNVTLPMALLWTTFAAWAAIVDFDPASWAHYGLMVTSIYLLGAGAAQQIMYGKDG